MGLSYTTIVMAGDPFPWPTKLILECDSAMEFFCRGVEEFKSPDGFIGGHAAAMRQGWLERNGPDGRIWLCPACSGK